MAAARSATAGLALLLCALGVLSPMATSPASAAQRAHDAAAATTQGAHARHRERRRVHAQRAPSVVVSMASWRLPNGLSRAGAAPLPNGRVLLLAGLLGSGASSADVGVLDTATGRLTSIATLPSPTHDAGSAELDGRAFLFGGGQSVPFALVQGVTIPRSLGPGTAVSATVTGQLPQLRADDEAVTVGRAAYVVGGYDGSIGDAAVLETANGSTFSTFVTLPVAVRYAAVTAANGVIYVFGGEAEQGGTTSEFSTPAGSTTPPPGQQVAVVQEIDTRTHTARVLGSLPHALQGAAAFDLGGHIYLAGGDSYPPGSAPVSGSTVWSFDPSTVSFRVAGHLAAPVSYAAVAVEHRVAWLIGGERNGVPVASAQRVRLRAIR